MQCRFTLLILALTNPLAKFWYLWELRSFCSADLSEQHLGANTYKNMLGFLLMSEFINLHVRNRFKY